jgi:dienelactone hydrolase
MKAILPLALLASAAAAPAAAQIVPVRDFARPPAFEDVKLSPNGDYIATGKKLEKYYGVGFIRLSDFAVTGGSQFDEVFSFDWVGPERVVVELGLDFGYFLAPRRTGELVGVDVDGKRRQYLFGQHGTAASGTRIAAYSTYMNAWGEMVDPLPRDPEWALIKVGLFGKDTETHDLYRLNVYTGVRHQELKAPGNYISHYLTDLSGRVRYATGAAPPSYILRSYVRNPETDQWTELAQGALAKAQVLPLNYSEQGNAVWFDSDEIGGDRACLVRQDLATGKRAPVVCDERQTLAETVDSADRSHPVAAVFSAGRPDMRVLEPESEEGKRLLMLINTFPDLSFSDFSYSLDGSKMLFRAYSDRDPGSYYLLDAAKGKLKRVAATRPWIKPEQMGERRPIAFRARDGRPIYGYLTLPPGREAKALPVVVLPHGGPSFVRDNWEWDAEPQLLASRGYAVLQVNFRGSGGYGNSHIQAGKKNWVGMVNDLTDGLRFVVQRGLVDAKRACIYGGSFGGYAALMSAVREPDAYKCVIDYAGVYDIPSFKRRTDIAESFHGNDEMAEFIADTPELEREQSPSTYIDQLKAPVMIVHGEEDTRVPFDQAKQLRSALEARKHPYEWLTKAREEHGFYSEDNRVEFYEKILAFLEKNIGPGAAVMPEAKPKK